MSLIACKECQAKVSTTADKCPQCGAAVPKGIGIGTVLKWAAIAWGGYAVYSCTAVMNSADRVDSPTLVAAPAAAVSGPPLELLSWRCEKLRNYARVKGEVKNISGQTLKNIMAVGTMRTKSGELVDSAEALLDLHSLLPNQQSAFDVMISDNPLGVSCNIAFKTIRGESVEYK